MEIITFGKGERIKRCAAVIAQGKSLGRYGRLILLPIPTTKDKKYITNTTVQLCEVTELVTKNTLVAGYEIPAKMSEEIALRGGEVYDAGQDEKFLLENAAISAHGIVGYILSELTKDISELNIGVVGYGRIGEALVRGLLFFGAGVRVYTARESVAISLCENGISARVGLGGDDFSALDVIINTSPSHTIDSEMLEGPLSHLKVIDVASGNAVPSGDNVVRLMAIPERMYPETAGRTYARYISERMGCIL
ncbi:MAG: hypothetical protein IJX92_02030 [Clostridia bacterium]|nr:hypothetical protein [Clostridia bacterium]